MLKSFQLFLIVLLGVALTGCMAKPVSVKNVTVRGYLEDRERVDQNVSGNSGYLKGAASESSQNTKKTRKIYVLEVTKELKDKTDVKSTKQSADVNSKTESNNAEEMNQKISLPSSDQVTDMAVSAGGETEYVIEKDDTLQKISKKFYNSYSKWTQIYEANKETLKDPNNIKPGLTIKIPNLQ